jgi:hypothetical protein
MIGPFNPEFNSHVGKYIRNSPTHDEIQCLRDFFESASRHPIISGYREIKSHFYLIARCNHVIEIFIHGNKSLVHNIYRGAIKS